MKLLAVFLLITLAFADTLDGTAETAVVSAHNSARLDANPPPVTPLTPLTYDQSIEIVASNYVDGCVYQHSTGSGYGENLYATTVDYGTDISGLVQAASVAWEAEEADYTLTSQSDSCATNKVCGHYTQMVWADTTLIGCGIKRCSENSPFGVSFPDWSYVVCNYDAPGNVDGELPYVASDGCDVPTECANAQYECGDASICGGTFNCGTCSTGYECNSNVCELIVGPCATCGPNTQCISDQCVCLPGYVESGGLCELANPSAPNIEGQFTQTLPLGGADFVDQDGTGILLELVQSGEHYLRWDRSTQYFDTGATYFTADIHQTDGSFGIGALHGQPDNENDMLKWVVKDISGGFAGLQICIGRFGTDYCSDVAPIQWDSSVPHTITVFIEGVGNEYRSTFQIDDSYIWQTSTEADYFPNTGSIAYYFNPEDDTPTISKVTLFTAVDFQVDLFGCLDDTQWQQVITEYTGYTGFISRNNGENGCCDCAP